MRIGLDASWAAARGTGTATYTEGLVRALVAQPDHEIVLYFKPGDEVTNPLFALQTERRIVGGAGQPGRSLLGLAGAARRDCLDVFHSPGYFLPLWGGPKVVTFHDANMFRQWRTWWRPRMRLGWLSLCGQTVLASRLARAIVTDSQAAAASLQEALHLPSHRLYVLYPGIDERFLRPAPPLPPRYNLGRYLLSVGVLSPQKNLEGMLHAFALLGQSDFTLAVAGREDGAYFRQTLLPLVQRLGLQERVRFLGVVPDDDLPALYASAEIFLYPSFAEGFGLPPLEAMAAGTPVIASRATSLPEILGDAAEFVNPHEPIELATAMDKLLANRDLRASLTARGSERVQRFRWKEAAQRALEIYAAVA